MNIETTGRGVAPLADIAQQFCTKPIKIKSFNMLHLRWGASQGWRSWRQWRRWLTISCYENYLYLFAYSMSYLYPSLTNSNTSKHPAYSPYSPWSAVSEAFPVCVDQHSRHSKWCHLITSFEEKKWFLLSESLPVNWSKVHRSPERKHLLGSALPLREEQTWQQTGKEQKYSISNELRPHCTVAVWENCPHHRCALESDSS